MRAARALIFTVQADECSSFQGVMMVEHNQRSLVSAELADIVSGLIRSREKRGSIFSRDIFSDPAWDILLVLFLAELRQHRMTPTQVARTTSTPITTTLRWMETLERKGWIHRRPDPFDRRRLFVELSAQGSAAMHAWLDDWMERQAKQAQDSRIQDLLTRISRGDQAPKE